MKRRTFITGAGSIAAASTAGGAFLVASSDPASAGDVETTDNIDSTILSGKSDSGRIDDVTLEASGTFEWTGLQDDAKYAEVCLYVRSPGGEWERMARAVNDEIEARSRSTETHHFSSVGGSLFENTSWNADAFPQPAEGQTASKTLDVRIRVIVYENGRGVKDDTDHEVTIKITNVGRGLESTTEIDGEVHTSNETGNGTKPGGIPGECNGDVFCDPDPYNGSNSSANHSGH